MVYRIECLRGTGNSPNYVTTIEHVVSASSIHFQNASHTGPILTYKDCPHTERVNHTQAIVTD